jgi:hypothetical protein
MAQINIANVTTIKPVMQAYTLTTSGTAILDVPTHSCMKIDSIYLANKDGTNTTTASVYVSDDNGSSSQYLIHLVPIPPGTSISILDTPIYLDETDLLYGEASANGDIDMVVSGVEMID